MILHASGFVDDGRPSNVRIAAYDDTLANVASAVIAEIERHGHPTEIMTVRSLTGELKEVHAYTSINESELWHVFSEPGEQWPMKMELSDSGSVDG